MKRFAFLLTVLPTLALAQYQILEVNSPEPTPDTLSNNPLMMLIVGIFIALVVIILLLLRKKG